MNVKRYFKSLIQKYSFENAKDELKTYTLTKLHYYNVANINQPKKKAAWLFGSQLYVIEKSSH